MYRATFLVLFAVIELLGAQPILEHSVMTGGRSFPLVSREVRVQL